MTSPAASPAGVLRVVDDAKNRDTSLPTTQTSRTRPRAGRAARRPGTCEPGAESPRAAVNTAADRDRLDLPRRASLQESPASAAIRARRRGLDGPTLRRPGRAPLFAGRPDQPPCRPQQGPSQAARPHPGGAQRYDTPPDTAQVPRPGRAGFPARTSCCQTRVEESGNNGSPPKGHGGCNECFAARGARR